jgi:hypothetical protein
MGQVINFSRVFCLVSQGKTIGAMEVAVKNITSASNPDNKYLDSIVRPIVNAKNKIIGKATPWIATGPLL